MDANENPFTLQEPLKKRLLEEMGKVNLNRYPEAGAPELRDRFARYYGVNKDMIMLGNGSDELIQTLCLTLKGKVKGVLIPTPTFVMYEIIAVNTGNKVLEVRLPYSSSWASTATRSKPEPTCNRCASCTPTAV